MVKKVEEAISAEAYVEAVNTINILEYIQSNKTTPEDSVTVYQNIEGAYKLRVLEDQIQQERNVDTASDLEDQANRVREAIKNTSLTFHLRGMSPQEATDLFEAASKAAGENGEADEIDAVIAAHIVYISTPIGEDRRAWTRETIKPLLAAIPQAERLLITKTVMELSYPTDPFKVLRGQPDF